MPKKTFIIIVVVAAIGTVIAYASFRKEKRPTYEFITAEKMDIVEEVAVTGNVEPAQQVELAFEIGGKVDRVYAEIGEKVFSGRILVTIENDDMVAQVHQIEAEVEHANTQVESAEAATEAAHVEIRQIQASLDLQNAKLQELKNGVRTEEIDIAEVNYQNAQKRLDDAIENQQKVEEVATSEREKAEQSIKDAEVSLANASLKAQVDLDNLYSDVKDILNEAYSKADDAIYQQTDDMFTSVGGDSVETLNFVTSDTDAKNASETLRLESKKILMTFSNELKQINEDENTLDNLMINGNKHLVTIRDYINTLSDALDSALNLSESVINIYKTGIQTARTNVNTSLASINNQQQLILSQRASNETAISNAENQLSQSKTSLNLIESSNKAKIQTAQSQVHDAGNMVSSAEAELKLKKAGATEEQIKAQQALVDQAQGEIESHSIQVKQAKIQEESKKALLNQALASLENANAKLNKTILRSPINGIVAHQDAKEGQIVSPGVPIVSVISVADSEIKVNVPEVDIAKIQVSDSAQVTLDAYGDDIVFRAFVSSIDPAESMVEGVPTYKTTLHFVEPDERIKSGMTANITIITDSRLQVIAIPQRAIITEGSIKKVKKPTSDQTIAEIEVKTGLKGSDGNIEILEGLKEGDKVIVFEAKEH